MRWAMCGDWAPMPMNVRGPKRTLKVSSVWDEPLKGQHYEGIIMDDVVSEPKPLSEAQRQIIEELNKLGMPETQPKHRTATEAMNQRTEAEQYYDALSREQEWLYGLRPIR